MSVVASNDFKVLVSGRNLRRKHLVFSLPSGEEYISNSRKIKFNILARVFSSLKLEYSRLDPNFFSLAKIFISKLLLLRREFTLSNFFLTNIIGHEYRFDFSPPLFPIGVRLQNTSSPTWVSRKAISKGVIPHNLSHSIEYDFLRMKNKFELFVWDTSLDLDSYHFRSEPVTSRNDLSSEVKTLEIMEIENATIFHGNLVVKSNIFYPIGTNDFQDNSWPSNSIYEGNSGYCYFALSQRVPGIEKGLYLGSSSSWFHFLVEIFPRFLKVNTNYFSDHIPVLGHDAPAQIVSLVKDLTSKEAVLLAPLTKCEVKKLITCNDSRFSNGLNFIERKSDLYSVRNYMIEKYSDENEDIHTKLLVKRGNNLFRSTANFELIEIILRKKGFTVINSGELSISEQVILFSRADVVIAETGAAMTNLMFCDEGTKVIELNTHRVDPGFWTAYAETFGVEVQRIFGKKSRIGMEIDMAELLDNLQ